MLADLVKHKKLFFNAAYARYDECLAGGLRLIPDTEDLASLEADYMAMVAAGMFYSEPMAFPDLIAVLRDLEARINAEVPSS